MCVCVHVHRHRHRHRYVFVSRYVKVYSWMFFLRLSFWFFETGFLVEITK